MCASVKRGYFITFLKRLCWPARFLRFGLCIDGVDGTYSNHNWEEIKQDFAIYPNPASHSVELRFNTNNYIKANVLITDMVGRIVYHQEKIVLDGKLDITTQNWSEGIYRVQVYQDKDLLHSAQLQISKP